MKIRSGFVSNSSSSSFILKLPKIESKKDLEKIMYGEDVPLFLTSWDDDSYATGQVLDIVYRDIMDAMKSSMVSSDIESIRQSIEMNDYTYQDFDKLISKEYKNDYDKLKSEFKDQMFVIKGIEETEEYRKLGYFKGRSLVEVDNDILEEIGDKMKDVILKSVNDDSNDVFITLEYSDNDGILHSFIEHGGVLDPITISRISHH